MAQAIQQICLFKRLNVHTSEIRSKTKQMVKIVVNTRTDIKKKKKNKEEAKSTPQMKLYQEWH